MSNGRGIPHSILLLLGLGLLTRAAGAAGGASPACTEIPLQGRQPLWITSAVWLEEKHELAVVDHLQNQILVYSADGRHDRLESSRLSKLFPLPAALVRSGGSVIAHALAPDARRKSELFELDAKSNSKKSVAILTDQLSPAHTDNRYRLLTVVNFTVSGDLVAGIGKLQVGASEPGFGFFQAGKADPKDVTLVEQVWSKGEDYHKEDYYALGFRYVAPAAGGFYYLRVVPGERWELKSFINGKKRTLVTGDRVPELKSPMHGPENAEELYSEIETLSLPVGLVSHEAFAYVVVRQPKGHGLTEWRMLKIDPTKSLKKADSERIVDSIRLPTSADFIEIVTAPDRLLILERGRVGEMGRQQIDTMLEIPVANLSSASLKDASRCMLARP